MKRTERLLGTSSRNVLPKEARQLGAHRDDVLIDAQDLQHCPDCLAFGWVATLSRLEGRKN